MDVLRKASLGIADHLEVAFDMRQTFRNWRHLDSVRSRDKGPTIIVSENDRPRLHHFAQRVLRRSYVQCGATARLRVRSAHKNACTSVPERYSRLALVVAHGRIVLAILARRASM